MVAPPGDDGCCSFGVAVDFAAELWPDIPVRIAHINPRMPRTAGDAGIPFDALTAYVEGEQDLYTAPTARADPVRSEEHTSELQSLMRISYAVFCLKKKNAYHTTRLNQ